MFILSPKLLKVPLCDQPTHLHMWGMEMLNGELKKGLGAF